MSPKVSTPDSRPARWLSFLTRTFAGALTGAVLAGGYGALVAGVRLASTGRWGRGPAFALGALLTGAVVGLVVGIALGISRSRKPRRRGSGARIPWLLRRDPRDNSGYYRQQC
jgi:hypothetical protein